MESTDRGASFATRRDALTGRIRSLGRYGFARASEEPYRRRPLDAIALVLGTLVVAILAERHNDPSDFENRIFTAINGLPDDLEGVAKAVFQLGTLWALGIIVVAALLARRWRLTRDLFLAGFLAWLVGHVLALTLGNESFSDSVDAIVRGHSTQGNPFPLIYALYAQPDLTFVPSVQPGAST